MPIPFAGGVIRPWKPTDLEALVTLADNRAIWRNLVDAFPHPYRKKDARAWIKAVASQLPCQHFAVCVRPAGASGKSVPVVAGGIGVTLGKDIRAGTAEVGYWLGEPYWGRGLMTSAVEAFTEFAFREYKLRRLFAQVLAWNPASMRVLEKSGYAREGTLRNGAKKDGKVVDEVLYARIQVL